MAERAPRPMAVADFLVWESRQAGHRHELVDGRPVAMTGATFSHDRVVGNVAFSLKSQYRATDNPCDPFTADIAVMTGPRSLRRPDVSVHCPPFDEKATASDRPKLVVEVLSRSTEHIDQYAKLSEYQQLASLEYILLISPDTVEAGFWQRTPDRAWGFETFHDLQASIDMPRLGACLRLSELYDRVTLALAPPRLVRPGDSA